MGGDEKGAGDEKDIGDIKQNLDLRCGLLQFYSFYVFMVCIFYLGFSITFEWN